MRARGAVRPSIEQKKSDFLELSDEELCALVDTNTGDLLGISGEEFFHRLRERNPLTDDLGRPVPAWGSVAMLADLLDD